VRVRILGLVKREESQCGGKLRYIAHSPIPHFKVRGRHTDDSKGEEIKECFRKYPQDIPGKPGKWSRSTDSRGPRRTIMVRRAAFTHPAR